MGKLFDAFSMLIACGGIELALENETVIDHDSDVEIMAEICNCPTCQTTCDVDNFIDKNLPQIAQLKQMVPIHTGPVVAEQLVLEQLVPEQLVLEQMVPEQMVPEQLVPEQLVPMSSKPHKLPIPSAALGGQRKETSKEKKPAMKGKPSKRLHCKTKVAKTVAKAKTAAKAKKVAAPRSTTKVAPRVKAAKHVEQEIPLLAKIETRKPSEKRIGESYIRDKNKKYVIGCDSNRSSNYREAIAHICALLNSKSIQTGPECQRALEIAIVE